jgi:circadian clock protein KaiC
VDTWIMVQDSEFEAERKRTFTIMKSRGMAHSKMVKQFNISKNGISLSPVSQKERKDRESGKQIKE